MKVVIVEPGQYARIAEIDNTLEAEQKIVGGLIDVVYSWQESVGNICNDEGILLNMPLNRIVPGYTAIHGPFIVCGLGEEDFIGLTDEQAQRYCAMFHRPQLFVSISGHLVACPCTPESYNRIMGGDKNKDTSSAHTSPKPHRRDPEQ